MALSVEMPPLPMSNPSELPSKDPTPLPSLPPQRPRRRWLSLLLKASAGLGGVVFVGGGVFVILGDYIVTTYILPRIEVAIEDAVNRPIKLGKAKGTSLWGVRLGETVIPPTADDESTVVVKEVEVELGLRSLITQRIIKPNIILIEPKVSLIQAEDETWGDLSLPEVSEEEPRVKLELQSVAVKNASLTAKPYTTDAEAIIERKTLEIDLVNGTLEFYGGENADELTLDLAGDIETGEFNINSAANLEDRAIKADIRAVDLDATDVNPFLPDEFGLSSGLLNANVSLTAALTEDNQLNEDITEIKGTARFRDGVFLAEALSKPVSNISSQLVFKGKRVSLENTSLQLEDIVLVADGDIDIEDGYNLTAQIPNVTLIEVENVVETDLPNNLAGAFDINVQVTGELTSPFIQGQLNNIGPVQIDQLSLATLRADFGIPLPEFSLNRANLNDIRIEPQAGGLVTASSLLDLTDLDDPQFQLSAEASGLPADTFAQIYGVDVPREIAIGILNANIEAFGDFQAQTADVQWQLSESTFPGRGDIKLVDNIGTLSNTQLQVSEGLVTANGQVDLFDLDNPQFQLNAIAERLSVDTLAQTFNITVPPEIVVRNLSAYFHASSNPHTQTAAAQLRLSESTFPGSGEVTLLDNIATLDNTRLQVAEGVVTAEAILELTGGDWQAAVNTDQVPIRQFTNQADGQLSADIVAAGNLNALDLEQIQAEGTATIANARLYANDTRTPLLEPGLWTTAFVWEGGRIAVDSFTAPSIQANGVIGVDFSQQIPIDDFDLDVVLQSFDIRSLNRYLPAQATEYATLAGLTSFTGQLSGTLQAPQLQGNASIKSLAVNQLLFETLSGPVALTPTGTNVNLQGQQDQIQLIADGPLQANLQQQTWPELSFEVRNQDFVAKGSGEGRQLSAKVSQLPLNALNIRPVEQYGFDEVGGLLNARVDLDLASFANPIANGTLTVTDPTLNPVEADKFTATFVFADSTATLSQGELLLNNSRYLLTGSANLENAIDYQGQLTIAEGRIEDLIPIVKELDLSSFSVQDSSDPLGNATDLATNPVGLPPNTTFLEKLESFVAFVQANPLKKSETGDIVIPELEELAGAFNGTIDVAGESLAIADLTANFNIQGESWTWDTYTTHNEFLFSGSIQENTLDIDSAFISAGATQIDLAGSGDLNQLSGQLVVENLPVEIAQLVYPLPVDIDGDLNLTTTLGGSLANPTVEGEAIILAAEVNSYDIEGIAANFTYSNAILTLDSEVAILSDTTISSLPAASATVSTSTVSSPVQNVFLNSTRSGNLSNHIAFAKRATAFGSPFSQSSEPTSNLLRHRLSIPASPIATNSTKNSLSKNRSLENRPKQNSLTQNRLRTPARLSSSELITLKGTVPYAFPFMGIQPSTNQISLRAVVPNNSFEIINAFTDGQIQWESGQGQMVVDVGGTLQQPAVAGQARFQNGTLSSPLLANALTDINGSVQFDLTRINIEQLQANMGEGRVAITGQLPLLSSGQSILTQAQLISQSKQTPPEPAPQNGLFVSLENLPIDYSNILEAVFTGQVLVSSAVLAPTVSGNVTINDGQIQANQLLQQAGSLSLPTAEDIEEISPYRVAYLGDDAFNTPLEENPVSQPTGPFKDVLDQITIQNFELTFGDRLAIVGTPFYNITAIGDLAVNGPLTGLQPLGTIELKSGWINLFSTQFRLDSGAANTATFTPEAGLNPYVDVVLTARVKDTDITPAPPSAGGFLNAEVNESTVDSIGSVSYTNVQAVAMGPATELSDTLTLTSNSSRSQGELLALLGSGVFADITTASYTQVAEYIGGGALTGFGDRIAEAVGLDSFRVFPTTDPDADSSSIGIGIEASASIGNRFDISVLEILNSTAPPQLGVEYRINNQLNLSGQSNLDRTEFELEYRIEF